MKPSRIILILTFFIFLSSSIFASVQDENLQNRQRVRENIITLKWLRLTQALDLTEEQAAKIFPFVNRIEKQKLQIQKSMSKDIGELRRILKESPLFDPKKDQEKEMEIFDKLKSHREYQRLIRQKDEEIEDFLEKNLTTVQKAKYLLFQVDFYRGLGETLDRARMMRNRGLQKQEEQ